MSTTSALYLSAIEKHWFGSAGQGRRSLRDRPPRVLLAEDDFEMRRLIAAAIRRDGYEVIEAKNGDELFDMLMKQLRHPVGTQPPELIISDLRMPGLTGLDVLRELRESDWATPFVLITAFGGAEIRDRALRGGAAAVFDKPFDIDDLRTVVVNLVGRPE